MKDQKAVIPIGQIEERILLIRGQKVMLDADLADLYGVTTKRLNEQVKRNCARFPKDFMFQLTEIEKPEVVANCDPLSKQRNEFGEDRRLKPARNLKYMRAFASTRPERRIVQEGPAQIAWYHYIALLETLDDSKRMPLTYTYKIHIIE